MAIRSSEQEHPEAAAVGDAGQMAPGRLAPGPKGAPFIGSVLPLLRDPLGFMHKGMLEYGDVVRVLAGPKPVRVTAYGVFHPDGVQHVLAANADNYRKDAVYDQIRNLLGDGLLTSEGETWKRQKRLVQPLFTHKMVTNYVPMILAEADELRERWARATAAGTPVDLHAEMTRVTLRVVGKAVFGTDVDHMIPIFRDSVPYLSRRAYERAIIPYNIPEDWPLPSNRKAATYKKDIYDVVEELIASRRHQPTEGEDLLNLLLAAQDPEGGVGLTDEEVRDQALIFLMAGHETTATALTFTFHLLGFHPAAQRKVQEEVDEVLGRGDLTLEGVRSLAYTTMAVKEAMRLYPSAYGIARTPLTDDSVGGYRIEAGSTVVTSPWVTHRHPGFWDDPLAFIPDRFSVEHEKARHRYAYFPFGGGPRACIGQYFSMLEAVIVTAVLLRSFEVSTVDKPVKLFTGITLRPDHAMPAGLVPRAACGVAGRATGRPPRRLSRVRPP